MEMQSASAEVVRRKSHGRSRVSNGNALFAIEVDGRGVWARRLRDLITDHENDLGGAEACSVAERSIVRRAATLTVEAERLEARFALAGQATPDELDLYQRVSNTLRRQLEAIGLQRRARDVTPQLSQVVESIVAGRQKAVDSFSDAPGPEMAGTLNECTGGLPYRDGGGS